MGLLFVRFNHVNHNVLVIRAAGKFSIGNSCGTTCHRVKKKIVKLYHRTSQANEILAHGFRDSSGHYLTDRLWTGVCLSDVPLDENEGADGDTLLMLKIPKGVIVEYEWIEEGKPYREFLAPASLVNQYGPPKVVDPVRGSLLRRTKKSGREPNRKRTEKT